MSNSHKQTAGSKEAKINLYGPRCLPLFYTALLDAPRRLKWSKIAGAGICRVTLGWADATGRTTLWEAYADSQEETTWELPALDLTPGRLYDWQVEPIFATKDHTGREGRGDTAREDNSSDREARFWLLDADALEHVKYGMGLLEQSPNPEFALLAQAILLSEAGLFQEALRLVQKRVKEDQRPIQSLLTDTALSVIYREMERHLNTQQGLPACFSIWVRNREQYHRGRVQAQMTDAQVTKPHLPGAGKSGRVIRAL